MANSFKNVANQAEGAVEGIIIKVKELDQVLLAAVQNLKNLNINTPSTPSGQKNNNKQQQQEIQKLKTSITQLKAEITKLNQAQSTLASQTNKTTTAQQSSAVATNKSTTAQNSLLSAYARLIQKQKEAKAELQRLVSGQEVANQKYLDAEISLKKLEQAYARNSVLIKKFRGVINNPMSSNVNIDNARKALESQVRARERLTVSIQKEKSALSQMSPTRKANTDDIKKANNEYNRLTKKVNQANNATNNFSKSGLGQAVSGFKRLLGAFGIAGGIYLFAQFTREIFNLTKKLQSLDFALRTIVSSNDEFVANTKFLSQITNAFGADLITTTERYTKFLAAAKQSNVSLKDTQKIFSSVTKASGVLGLKTDELTGIYLALEQMLSKGKVTTEELRRQLGERLPGAFGIMADAVGVTVAELDNMLRKGEIMSAEALPKFAVALEKAYGISSIKKVDTLVAAHIRLSNSFKEAARAFNEATGIDRILISLFNGISSLIDATVDLDRATQQYSTAISQERSELNSLVTEIINTNKEEENREKMLDRLIEKYPFFLQYLGDEKTSNEQLINGLKEVNKLYIKRLAIQRLSEKLNLEDKENRLADATIQVTQATEEYRKELTSLNLILNKGTLDVDLTSKSLENQAKVLKETILKEQERLNILKARGEATQTDLKNLSTYDKALLALTQRTSEYNKVVGKDTVADMNLQDAKDEVESLEKALGITTEQLEAFFGGFDGSEVLIFSEKIKDGASKIKDAIQGTVDWYKQQIKKEEDLRDSTAKTSDAYASYQKKIDELNAKLKLLIGTQKKLDDQILEPSSKKAIQNKINALKQEIDSIGILNPKYKDLTRTLRVYEGLLKSIYGDDTTNKIKNQGEAVYALYMKFNNFLRSFSREAMSDFGFDTLNEILTLEDNGKSIFSNMLSEIDALPDSVASASEKAAAKFGIYFTTITEVAQEAFNFMQQNQQAYFDAQFLNLEKERDIAIQFAGDSATAREEIQRQYEDKRRKIQAKQAKAQQEQALFNVIVNTAQGVVAALTSTPPNIPMSIAVGLIGAAQASMIKSQPIPEFWKGTNNAPQGLALVDEKRPEVHTDRKGNIKSLGEQGANYRYLNKGDKIFKSREEYFNKELSSMLNVHDILPYNEVMGMKSPIVNIKNDGIKKEDFVREINNMTNRLLSKETSIVTLDKKGFQTSIKKGNTKRNLDNNILNLKGGVV